MRFLRRESTTATASTAPADSEAGAATLDHGPAGKGRPTPKRRDAQARRRGPVAPPPRTQREAYKRSRDSAPSKGERRSLRAVQRERMAAGDERYLLPRDRGPVRAYVRDLVDSRRNLMGLFMPLAVVVLLAVVAPVRGLQQYASVLCMAMLLAMVVEGVLLGRMIAKRVRRKYPDESAGGLSIGWYAFTRASQIRKLRMPKPRVRPGDTV